MAPPAHTFASSQILYEILLNDKGGRRKDLPRDFDIKRDCAIERLFQYRCEPVEVKDKAGNVVKGRGGVPATKIECVEVERIFRR